MIFLGHENVTRTLIDLGAVVDSEDDYKETPLFNAASEGEAVTYSFRRF